MSRAHYADWFIMPTAEYLDTCTRQPFVLIVNELVKDLTDASIELTVKALNGTTVRVYTIGNGIIVTDAISGEFYFGDIIINILPSKYTYEIKFTFADGSVKTYLEGEWEIAA